MSRVTADTLRADRDRRWREREEIAAGKELAADVLDEAADDLLLNLRAARQLRDEARHLRYDADGWRRTTR